MQAQSSKGEAILLKLLSANPGLSDFHGPSDLAALQALFPEDLAFVYVHAAYLSAVTEYLAEQYWLQGNINFLTQPQQCLEFSEVPFLHPLLSQLLTKNIKAFEKQAVAIEDRAIRIAKTLNQESKKQFAQGALSIMTRLFLHEESLQDRSTPQASHAGPRLYRCFDLMDDFLGLDYSADHNMKTDLHNTERLYEGAGIGVQSGYSTVLLALYHMTRAKHIVDLGSGYGRVGIMVGLIQPEVQFTGYEYVDHRVQIANKVSAEFGLQNKIQFLTQDLSDRHFQIPSADAYYLYDPFSAETYQYVLQQLVQLSRKQTITIVTKGNARGWLMDIAKRESWPAPLQIDAGNLCLFESAPRLRNDQLALADADQPLVHLL